MTIILKDLQDARAFEKKGSQGVEPRANYLRQRKWALGLEQGLEEGFQKVKELEAPRSA